MSLYGSLKDIIQGKARELQNRTGSPDTRVDSGGSTTGYTFDGQDIDRGDLRDIRDIRTSGGVISQLVHAKALMQFGTGVEFEADDDEVADWLRDEFNDLDNLLIDIGEDAIWYPYSIAEIVETQGGGFSHVEPIEPWTMLPKENEYGEVIAWIQEVRQNGSRHEESFEPDEIASFVLNKASARDRTGISEVMRAEEEVMQFRENRKAVNSAIEIAGFPHHVWKVGREGAAVIDDNELRRVRNMVESMEGDTQFVMGRDIEHDMIKPGDFKFEAIQEHDLRELALALGLPLELANVGSDGLGSGMPAELRLTLFERQARAAQRALADQFVQQVIRPVLEEYSPFNADVNVNLRFGDPIEEEDTGLQEMAPYLTTNEIRERLDKPPAEDDEIGESYRKPADIQAPDEEQQQPGMGPGGGGGGFFRDARVMEKVPDNAVSIDDRSEAPEDANIIEGPQGGLYYVPGGSDGGQGNVDNANLPSGADAPDSVDVSNAVDVTNLSESDIDGGRHADDMRIVETADGDNVFMTETSNTEMIERSVQSADAMSAAGANVPEHYYYEETGELAVEGVDGQTAAEADDVDKGSLLDNVATAVAFGNTDMNPSNIVVDDNGEAHIIDTEDTATLFDAGQNAREAVEFALPTLEQHGIDADEFVERVHERAQDIQYDDGYYDGPEGSSSVIDWFAELPPEDIKSEVGL